MKFMFTIYHDENVLDAMPEKEMQALVDSAIEYARRSDEAATTSPRTLYNGPGRPEPSASAPARSPRPPVPLPRQRSSWVDSSSSRPRTWTRPVRWPRGSRRRASG